MRKLDLSLSLTSAAMAVRSAFKIANVNPVLWWDAESHRVGLAGGAATLFQDAAGINAGGVEQPVGLVRDISKSTLGSERNPDLGFSLWSVLSGAWTLSSTSAVGVNATGFIYSPGAQDVAWSYWEVSGTITGYSSGYIYVSVTTGTEDSPRISGNGAFKVRCQDFHPADNFSVYVKGENFTGTVTNLSIRQVIGLNAFQSTSTARPVLTARKNLLTYSEQFDNASWAASGCVAVGSILTETAGAGQHRIQKSIASTSGAVYSISCEVERVGGSRHFMLDLSSGTNGYCYFDLSNGTHLLLGSGMSDVSVVGVGAGKYKISANFTTTAAALSIYVAMCSAKAGGAETYVADGSGVLSVKTLQVERSPVATSYQRVTTSTDYDITSAPLMLQFDGVDDALSTGTFAAGTLPSDADVYMVVKRDPGDGPSILIGNSWAKYVGIPDSTIDPQGPLDSGAGSTFQYVNGVPVTTRVQQDELLGSDLALFSANGCNLSTWTGLTVGMSVYQSYKLKGNIGSVLITTAQPDATRAKIRKALAKAYQITGVV